MIGIGQKEPEKNSQVYLVTRVEEEDKDERSEDKNYEDNNGDYLGREGQTEI